MHCIGMLQPLPTPGPPHPATVPTMVTTTRTISQPSAGSIITLRFTRQGSLSIPKIHPDAADWSDQTEVTTHHTDPAAFPRPTFCETEVEPICSEARAYGETMVHPGSKSVAPLPATCSASSCAMGRMSRVLIGPRYR